MSMPELLTDDQLEVWLASVQGWRRENRQWISKSYRFAAYMDGIEFVNRVAATAEKLNHHPFISIEYKLVTLRLTNWSVGGLTELDITAAAEFDRLLHPME